MLLELRLRNLAVAADVTVVLGPGLNVLSGSTGAGKSLVVEAIRWIRGEKIDPGLLRAGETDASTEAIFDLGHLPEALDRLVARGIDASDDSILRLRRQWKDGRSRAWIDGRLTSAALLQSACDALIEVQSQHQQLALLDTRGHARLLDEAPDLRPLAREYRGAFRRHQEIRGRVNLARDRQRALREQSELLRYQYAELEAAELKGDELEGLKAEVARLEGGAQLAQRVEEALEALENEDVGALAQLNRASARLQACSADLPDILEAREDLAQAVEFADQTRRTLESFRVDRDLSPEILAEKQDRLGELTLLCRKYSRSESELVALRERLRRDIESLDLGAEVPAELQRELDESLQQLEAAAKALQRARKREARHLERGAEELLKELGMEGAALQFELEAHRSGEVEIKLGGRRAPARAEGPTAVRLLVRTNPGESFGPVESTASGGELSRIGLALRSLAAASMRPTLLLLDEVDAGLGADLGPALARRLRALADASQVLVITHLPALAAAADTHLMASKATHGDRTVASISLLDETSREQELLRMIGGKTAEARQLARQLREDSLAREGSA